MKKLLVLIVLAFFAFLANGYGNFEALKGPEVTASTQNVPGEDSFITEIYHWDTTSKSYKLQDSSEAHIALRVPVNAWAKGKGYLSVYSKGDLHRYSSAYHPPDESPTHVSALEGDSKTRVKVGWGVGPFFLSDGYKGVTATATGTLVTDTSNKYELKGQGKLDDHGGGGSGSVGGVGGGTGGTSGSGGWVDDSTSFRVSVLDVRPKRPDNTPPSGSTPPSSGGSTPPSSGGSTPPSNGGSTPPSSGSTPPPDNTPNCQDCTSHCSSPCSCTNSGTCNGTVAAPPPPPATVSCGRSACTASVSSVNEHRLGPCGESTCGATSWSCGPYANWWQQQHRLRTCRRATCRQTWRNCSGGKPATCLANANWRCWAE